MDVRQGFTVEGEADLPTALAFADDHGFDFVELNMDYRFERDRTDATVIREAVGATDLGLVVHLPYRLDPGSPHAHVREGACRELEAAIDTADRFGVEKAVMHADSRADPRKWDHREIRALLYDSIRRVDAYADDRGIELCVENLKTPFFDASHFPDLFERTDAAGCLDTGHAHVSGQSMDVQSELLAEYGDRISHVHLNESRMDERDEHLPVGLGKLDFGALAAAIRESDWAGTCNHEVYTFDREYVAHGKTAFDRLLAEGDGGE